MYTVTKGVYIDFAHHIMGHRGPCINIHGHTWFFEITVQAKMLDDAGFVIDFKQLKRGVLDEVHQLLDHSFVVSKQELCSIKEPLEQIGEAFIKQQSKIVLPPATHPIGGAEPLLLGGMKVVVMPFVPTCERLAQWFFGVSRNALEDLRVSIRRVRVYESLHPVPAFAEYRLEDA